MKKKNESNKIITPKFKGITFESSQLWRTHPWRLLSIRDRFSQVSIDFFSINAQVYSYILRIFSIFLFTRNFQSQNIINEQNQVPLMLKNTNYCISNVVLQRKVQKSTKIDLGRRISNLKKIFHEKQLSDNLKHVDLSNLLWFDRFTSQLCFCTN